MALAVSNRVACTLQHIAADGGVHMSPVSEEPAAFSRARHDRQLFPRPCNSRGGHLNVRLEGHEQQQKHYRRC